MQMSYMDNDRWTHIFGTMFPKQGFTMCLNCAGSWTCFSENVGFHNGYVLCIGMAPTKAAKATFTCTGILLKQLNSRRQFAGPGATAHEGTLHVYWFFI